ncbi:hypothetical protein SCUCBS95973_005928 [Sporothrix curviconia]|uniref:Uncharacterized protein n=1 Tax=Sporothrix curviconia TaxID=1260050 RepID=A0ABP0C0V7_9PEZI
MPTATSINGYSLLNNGPLTTTFTAPATCTSDFTVLAAATQTNPPEIEWYADCAAHGAPDSCSPSGVPISSLIAEYGRSDARLGELVIYYSPGYICPSGWTTAGLATKDSSSLTMSGAFDVTSVLPTKAGTGFPFADPVPAVLVDALDAGETAVFCCPASFTAVYNGACISVLPTAQFTPTAGCLPFFKDDVETIVTGTFTIEGDVVTGALEELTATGSQPVSTQTTVFATAEASSYVGVLLYNGVMMVHQASDVTATPTATGTGAGATAATTSSSKSSAARASVRGSSQETTLSVLAVGCFALVLGSLFVL